MKDTIRIGKCLGNANSQSKDFSKLNYKRRYQQQFTEEWENKRRKIEQQKEQRNLRAEKRTAAKAKQAEEQAEQAENDLLVQRTQLSEKLRDFQANIQNLQKFIESKQLTGKISRKTNQLIENSYAVINRAKNVLTSYHIAYKELDYYIDNNYKTAENNIIKKCSDIASKNIILQEARINTFIYKYKLFTYNINIYNNTINKIEKTNNWLSEELSSLAKSSPCTDQPQPQHPQNSQQEQAILSSPDHQREKFIAEQIQKVDREIGSSFQSQV